MRMTLNTQELAKTLKALSDPKRLSIINLLSSGEKCACVLLEEFNISQPTLSHDMKLLCDTGLVIPRKEGKWTYYSLDIEKFAVVRNSLDAIFAPPGL